MKQALLLIDLQNDARDVITPGFLRALRDVIRRCEAKDIPVIHVLTEYTEEDLPLLKHVFEKEAAEARVISPEEI